ncbi:class I SAM-dependent methyltransferase [Lachnospiraceae bacterium 62-35]
MKAVSISDLPIVPEEYGKEIYERIDWTVVDSEMTDGQRRFINGLIQYYCPERVLELGVSAGGGTTVLLNALKENENAELYSIDSASQFYRNPDLPVGYCAMEKYADLMNKKWHLLGGYDPAEIMEKLDEKFDFCVIDTYHHHPVEVLNFISILPWLNDGAIVIMHDTTVFEWRLKETFLQMLAPRLLLSAVCAEKYIPDLPSGNMTTSNIAAWQVSADTRKYCQGLFDILYVPWETPILKGTCQSINELVKKHYPSKMSEYYADAVRVNASMISVRQFGVFDCEEAYKTLREDTIFYGAGFQMRKLLTMLDLVNLEFKFDIWDRNADKIQKIEKHTVKTPILEKTEKINQTMIVMIESKEIFEEVREQFSSLGYILFHGLKEYFAFKSNENKSI